MQLLEPSGDVKLRVAALGDIGLTGRVRTRMQRSDAPNPLGAVADRLRASDVAFANLEFPVADPSWLTHGGSREQWHDAAQVAGLAASGLTHVSLANNHIMDAGERGLEATLAACAEAGLTCVGAGRTAEEAARPAELQVGNRRVVLLARAETRSEKGGAGVAALQPERLREELGHWRSRADVLIMSVHWGSMYVDYPPPRVLDLSRIMIEEGVDLVLGHHAHVLQGVRLEDRTLLIYSLADGVFDSRSGEFEARVAAETRRLTALFDVSIAETHGVHVMPLLLDDDGIPMLASGEAFDRTVQRLQRLSEGLSDAAERFAEESAPTLLRYEIQSLAEYLRRGRIDRVLRLLGSVRPRHLPLLWQAMRRMGRPT